MKLGKSSGLRFTENIVAERRHPLEIRRRIVQNGGDLFSDILWKKSGARREALGPKGFRQAGRLRSMSPFSYV